jgi:hypothetical protein
MNLSTIVVSEEEATEKLAEYEAAVKTERSAEDVAIAQAYRAARRGLAVISLRRAIGEGGYFDDGMPRIAIARAGWPEAFCKWRFGSGLRDTDGLVFADDDYWRGESLVGKHHVQTTPSAHPETVEQGYRWRRAPVPLVPPSCRPKRPRLSNLHVLWEVESWSPAPSRDPALLKHIRGDLWAVLATWDLTDLELAVLAQRSA